MNRSRSLRNKSLGGGSIKLSGVENTQDNTKCTVYIWSTCLGLCKIKWPLLSPIRKREQVCIVGLAVCCKIRLQKLTWILRHVGVIFVQAFVLLLCYALCAEKWPQLCAM